MTTSDTPKTRAPDGRPWPRPRVAVSATDTRPYNFGNDDPQSLVTTMLDGPWDVVRAPMDVGDYVLLSPTGNTIEDVCIIKRKSFTDIRASLTRGHAALMAEMAQMSTWCTPLLIIEAPVEVLLGGRSGLVVALEAVHRFMTHSISPAYVDAWGQRSPEIDEAVVYLANLLGHEPNEDPGTGKVAPQSLLGSLLSIITDHRVPTLLLPSRAWAEYAAAWVLRRSWRRWLIDHPEGLEAERARLA